EDSTQLRDGTRQDVVGDKRVWPDSLYQTFFRNDLTCMRGKEHQHLQDLWFQANSTGRSSYAVQRGFDTMGIADVEAVLQNLCSMRDYSTAPEPAGVALHAIRRFRHRLEM